MVTASSSVFNLADDLIDLIFIRAIGSSVNTIIFKEFQKALFFKVGAVLLNFEINVAAADLEKSNGRILVNSLLFN